MIERLLELDFVEQGENVLLKGAARASARR